VVHVEGVEELAEARLRAERVGRCEGSRETASAQPEWLRNVYDAYGFGTLSSTAWAWGILDLLVGAIAIFAGFSVLRGGAFGQVMGLSIAGLSAIRWFFFLPVVPWVAITILAIDVLVVYGLVVHSEYFDTVRLQ
jgi:hypothetical protein